MHLVSSLVHDEPIEKPSSAVEDRVYAANNAQEFVVTDKSLAKGLVEGRYTIGHQNNGESETQHG